MSRDQPLAKYMVIVPRQDAEVMQSSIQRSSRSRRNSYKVGPRGFERILVEMRPRKYPAGLTF